MYPLSPILSYFPQYNYGKNFNKGSKICIWIITSKLSSYKLLPSSSKLILLKRKKLHNNYFITLWGKNLMSFKIDCIISISFV